MGKGEEMESRTFFRNWEHSLPFSLLTSFGSSAGARRKVTNDGMISVER